MPQTEPQKTPLVSVVIPTFNGEECLAPTLDSVLRQSYRDFEIIVVDDGSTDGTRRVLSQYDGQVRVVRQVNGGIASARNAGLRAARGSWIALLDHDDLWDETKLQRQTDFASAHPTVAMVYSRARVWRASREAKREETTGAPLPEEIPQFAGLLMGNVIPPLTTLFRRELALDVGGFRQDLAPADDWDLWLRIAKAGELAFLPDVMATYRLHGDNYHLRNMRRMIAVGDEIFYKGLEDIEATALRREALIKHFCWTAPAWGYTGNVKRTCSALFQLWRLGGARADVSQATLRSVRELGLKGVRRLREMRVRSSST